VHCHHTAGWASSVILRRFQIWNLTKMRKIRKKTYTVVEFILSTLMLHHFHLIAEVQLLFWPRGSLRELGNLPNRQKHTDRYLVANEQACSSALLDKKRCSISTSLVDCSVLSLPCSGASCQVWRLTDFGHLPYGSSARSDLPSCCLGG
jgi:hypothetical protein